MSAHKGKNTVKKPTTAMEPPMVARVVAIPKAPDATTKKTERIGDLLRSARLARNDDIYQIAEYLCIKPAFLVALENSQYSDLPADAYVIGFLRTYATFLGVDGKEAVDRYRYEMAGRRKKPVLSMPVPMSEGPAPSGLIMVGATIVVLLIYAVWYGISSSSRTEVNASSPLPTTLQQATAPASAKDDATSAAGLTAPVETRSVGNVSSTTATTMPPAAPGIIVTADQPPGAVPTTKSETLVPDTRDTKSPKDVSKDAVKDGKDTKDGQQVYGDPNAPSRVIIRAIQSSWVMITDDTGKAIFDHVLKTGDVYKVPNKKGLSLTTGNGNGIVLSLDGSELPKVATGAPHVVRNITLDPDQLTTETQNSDH